MLGKPVLSPEPIQPAFESTLGRRFNLIVAGSAGGKVRSAARLAGIAALLSGLRATQRDDYPITIKSGHSVSEMVFSPGEIYYTGISRPDALLILTEDGYRKASRFLPLMTPDDRLFVLPPFAEAKTQARVTVIDPSRSSVRLPKTGATLSILAAVLKHLELYPAQALEEAARRGPGRYVEENLKAITAGYALADALGAPI